CDSRNTKNTNAIQEDDCAIQEDDSRNTNAIQEHEQQVLQKEEGRNDFRG
ncbi:hypothetical protein A2U01_0068051, partial [Trifolium medium]|nr:hypothetical protein [Trifolium medium]